MRPSSGALSALLLALAARPLSCESSVPAVVHLSADPTEWKVAASIPPGALYHLVWKDQVSHSMQAIVRFPPGYRARLHPHPFNETLVVLRGRIRLRAGAVNRVLVAGDYAVLPANSPHELSVESRSEARVLATLIRPPENLFRTLEGLFGG